MTEAEWRTCNEPEAMLEYCQHNAFNARKNRLFAVACCRLIWNSLREWDRHAVDVSERYADGEASEEEFRQIEFGFMSGVISPVDYVVANARAASAWLDTRRLIEHFVNLHSPSAIEIGLDVAVNYIREVYGNPFRSVAVDPFWLTSNVVTLAESIYQDRSFDGMPILADALMDAGCNNDDILNHCRQPGEHVRGCWVIDLLTGRK
jgi:hypothetical protein